MHSTSNFAKWRLYTDGLISPNNFIDFGFYYLISAALQRRVWTGPEHAKLYPNIYPILVGDPGIGKGLVIKQVFKFLTYHKLKNPREHNTIDKDCPDKDFVKAVQEADYDRAVTVANLGTKKQHDIEKPLLFPAADSDTATFERLVEHWASSIRRINYKFHDEKTQKTVMIPYAHSSLAFCLEEMGTLFAKNTDKIVNLFIKGYDCGDYNYETKTKDKDRVKNCCLNFIAGTNPSFIQSAFDDRLFDEGFASRVFFIFGAKNRKVALQIPDLTPEQTQAKADILTHMEKLSHLYGRVEIEPNTWLWLEEWWRGAQMKRSNNNIRLNSYYARKNIHVFKLAMAIHFSDSLELHMGLSPFQEAICRLDDEEKTMHLALGHETGNPLAKPLRKVIKYIECFGPQTRKQLIAEFWSALPNKAEDMDSILEHLLAQEIVEQYEEENLKTRQNTIHYKIKEKALV